MEHLRAYLLGIVRHPRYLMGKRSPKQVTQLIARWWAKRWLLGRIQKVDILARVASHHFVHPVRHGARVPLPPVPFQEV
jgi:hypothetical protein